MITRNITHLLTNGADSAVPWSSARVAETCERLRQAIEGAQLDWDRDAGERWGRLLVEQQVIVAVSCVLPVALVRTAGDTTVRRVLDELGLVVIPFSEWDEPELEADEDVVIRVFHRDSWSDAVDPARFSASDLWWMTV